jgi:hypothetical protein
MEKTSIDKAIALADKNFTDNENSFSTPKTLELINQAQKILGIFFPMSYKKFVHIKGHGGPGGAFMPGIFDDRMQELDRHGVVWGVLQDRKSLGYPHHLIKLYDVGEGTTYCLDTSQMNAEGECPVVAWPIGGYEETPVLEIVAEDFGKFFLDLVEREIEYKKLSQQQQEGNQ